MTSTIIYAKMDVFISANQSTFSDSISLEQGVCIGVHFVPFSSEATDSAINIEISHSQGGVLLNPTDYRDYIHREGGYFAGMKQVNFPTNNNRFFVNVNAQKPLNKNFVGQLIFTIQRQCDCDNQ